MLDGRIGRRSGPGRLRALQLSLERPPGGVAGRGAWRGVGRGGWEPEALIFRSLALGLRFFRIIAFGVGRGDWEPEARDWEIGG